MPAIPYLGWWAWTGIAALLAGGWAANQSEDALEDGAELVKWAAIGGGLYVTYKALQSAGAIK